MFIKTVSTTSGVNPIKFDETGGVFYWILNTGSSTIYASTKAAFTAGDDGVVSLGPKESRRLETNNGTIYILGEGQVEIHNQRDGICSFKQAPTSSGGGGTIDAYSKTESDAKYAQKTDIPSSLPANGGNADTVDNKHATDFITGEVTRQLTTIDDCTTSGTYAVSTVYTTDLPTEFGTWGIMDVRVYGSGIFQVIYFTGTKNIIHRSKIMNQIEWTPWERINDGGNADTVDGYHVDNLIHASGSIPPEYITEFLRINDDTKSIERWSTGNLKVAFANNATKAENADTVDGLHAKDFSQIVDFGFTETDTKTAIGQLGKTAIYRCSKWTDYPSECHDGQGIVIAINYNGAGTAGMNTMWVRQIFITPHGGSLSPIYMRGISDTTVGNWKEISTTPIKKMTLPSVATNAGGGGSLFSADFGTPITIACTSRTDTQCTPFLADDGTHILWLVLAKDATTLDPIPVGSYSFDVWYI